MPNSVDTRIVEMQFDNDKFERKVRQSINSLDALDKSLEMKNAGKGFAEMEKAANSVDFSKMEKSLSFLEYRFTALGMTSAKIIDRMTSKIGGFFKSMEANTIGQIKSGGMARALKLEHANFMLDGILKDAQKVKDIMDNAVSPAVDGTAYGLDAAANAASQFVAAGLQDIDKLRDALTGISGVAAMSGASYEEIAHIFTKVASSGRAMGDTFMELSTRGINATAVLADYLKVSAAEVEEMRKKGQINFEMFADAMNKAYGEQAKKANDTFEGAMSNMKAALSRIGADFATPYLNNMRDIFNALRLTINDVRKALQPVVAVYVEAFDKVKQFTVALLQNEHFVEIYQNGIAHVIELIRLLSEALSPIGDGFRQAFPEGLLATIAETSKKITGFLKNLEVNKRVITSIGDAIGGVFSILRLGWFVIQKLFNISKPFFDALNVVLGTIITIIGIIGKLITNVTNLITSSSKASKVLSTIRIILKLMLVAIAQIIISIGLMIKEFLELPIVQEIFDNIYNAAINLANYALPLITKGATLLANAFGVIIAVGKGGASGIFTIFVDAISKFFNSIRSGGGFLKAFTSIFTGGFKNIPKTVHAAGKAIDGLNDVVGDSGSRTGIVGKLGTISDALTKFKSSIDGVASKVKEKAESFGFGRTLLTGYSAAFIALLVQGTKLAGAFTNALKGVPNVLKSLNEAIKAPLYEKKAKAVIAGIAVTLISLAGALFILTRTDTKKLFDVTQCLMALITLAGVFGLISQVVGKFASPKAFAEFGLGLLAFTGAITILAGALKIVSTIEGDADRLWDFVVTLGEIMFAFGAVLVGLSIFTKNKHILLGATFVLAFAKSIQMLVESLIKISNQPYAKMRASLLLLAETMGAMAKVIFAASLINPFAAVGFIGVVAGILILIEGVTLLKDQLDPYAFKMVSDFLNDAFREINRWLIIVAWAALIKNIAKAVDSIRKLFTPITSKIDAFATAAEIAAKGLRRIATAGVVLALAVLIKNIADAMKTIGQLKPEELEQGAMAAGGMIVAFIGLISYLAVLETVVGKNGSFLKDVAGSAIGISVVMIALANALKIIGSIPPENIQKALEALGWIGIGLIAFDAITMALSALGGKQMEMGIKTAIALAALISALSLCTALLSMLVTKENWSSLIVASTAIAILMTGMAIWCAGLSKVKFGPALVAAVGLIGVISVIGQVLAKFKDLPDPTNIIWIAATMVGVIGSISLMFALLSTLDFTDAMSAVVGLITVSTSMLIAATALSVLGAIKFDAMLPNLIALGVALGVLSGLFYLIGQIPIDKALVGVAGLISISFSLVIAVAALKVLETIDPTKLLLNIVNLGVIVTVLSGIVLLLGTFGFQTAIGVTALLGIAAIAGLFAIVFSIFQTINAMAVLPNIVTLGTALVVLSGIVILLGTLAVQTAIGVVALGAMVLLFYGFADIAKKLAEIDAFAMLQTLLVLVTAVGLMSLITIGLGAAVLSSGGLVGIMMGIGAAALIGFAVIMELYAKVGSDFAKTCTEIGTALPVFSAGLSLLGQALTNFAGKDFDGILGNLAAAMATIEGLSWMTGEAKSVAESVSTLSAAINDLDMYCNNITADATALEEAVKLVDDAVKKLVESIGKIPEALKTAVDSLSTSQLASIVSSFANALMTASDEKMPPVGRKFALDFLSGFSQTMDEQSSSVVYDFVGGLEQGVNENSEWAFNVGLALAKQFVEGFRSKDGIDSHSNAKEAIRAIIDWVGGLSQGQQEQSAKTTAVGTAGAKDMVTGFKNEIKDSTPVVVQTFQDMIGNVNANLPAVEVDVVTNPDALAQKLLGPGGNSVFNGLFSTKTSRDIQNESNDKQRRDMEIAKKMQQGLIKVKKESAEAAVEEANALAQNSKATGGSTKAKEENKEANEAKTEAIDEETGALEEETTAAEDNREEILALAETIEVVTKEFDKSFNHLRTRDNFKIVKNLTSAFSTFWSKGLGENGWKKASQITKAFKQVNKTIKGTTKVVKKGAYAFEDTGKYAGKLSKKLSKSTKTIEEQVMKTGKNVIKVTEGQAVAFSKVGNTVQRTTMRVSKNVKKLGQYFNDVRDFTKEINGINPYQFVMNTKDAYGFINKYRAIEKYFVKLGDMPQKIQDIMTRVNEKMEPFSNSLNTLGRRIDGVGNYMKKSSTATAYVQDAFVSLAATLYDGSDAANEYETEHAKLLFLFEHGEATIEEVEEHFRSYISRIMEALEEYRNSIEENLRGSLDIWSEFDKRVEDSNKNFLDTIESQIAGYNQWADMLFELSKRGMDMNILKMLTDEGVSSYGKLKSLLGMTANQIALFNQRYAESEAAITKARDTSLAALANATVRASQRAAAESSKTAKTQMKQSKTVAKRLIDDARAVAENQARYRSLTKQEEEKYLASLTAGEKEFYQKRLKEVRKAMKAEQKMAKKEETKRAREKKVSSILSEVKSFEKLRKQYHKYIGDAKMLKEINKQVAKSLENVSKKIKKFDGRSVKQMRYSWLAFAETLESTGNETNDYLTEMSERLENFVKEIENATKAGEEMFKTFEKGEKINVSSLFTGITSQTKARQDIGSLFDKVIKMGFSQEAIKYLYGMKDNMSEFYTTLESFASMTADQVALTNKSISTLNLTTDQLNSLLENGFANTSTAAAKIAVEDAQKSLDKNKSTLKSVTKENKKIIDAANQTKNALQKELKNAENQIALYQAQLSSKNLSKKERQTAQNNISNLEKTIASIRSKYSDADNKLAQAQTAINKAQNEVNKAQANLDKNKQQLAEENNMAAKQYVLNDAKKALSTAESEYKSVKKTVADENKSFEQQIAKLTNELNDTETKYTSTKDKATKKTLKAKMAEIKQSISALQTQSKKNTEKVTKAEEKYKKALDQVNAATAEYNKVRDEQNNRAKVEEAIQNALNTIDSYKRLKKVLIDYAGNAEVVKRANAGLANSMSGIYGAVDEFGKRWRSINDLSTKTSTAAFKEIAGGFLNLADAIADTNEEFDTFDDYIAARTQALSNYRDTLYDTIKGQVNLFDEFKRYSGEKPTSAGTYLDNMQSQLSGLEAWLTNLEILAKRGVNADLIAMFANEGQNSFEKVAAFASATEDEIIELVGQYSRYQSLLDVAADRAMATVGYSYTDAAIEATNKLVAAFKGIDTSRIQEEAYETGVMIINGVKDGLGHVMPELMADIADTAEEAAAKKAGAAIGKAINDGIVKAVSDNVQSTVNAAIERFKMAVDTVNSYVQNNLQSDYTITIHVNTSEIDAAVARMNAAINGINANAGVTQQAVATSQANQQALTPTALGAEAPVNNVTLNYTQNNTSPVALSRTEIYRQTQNQLSTINGAISAAMG